ncbi:hypothetical protein ATANTOWER_032826 [Ataeniobius toweri]|uniref:Uncharacterized protein n=1 Tax=Ataeniobius toweri TaxID=208326 RepID=A0ABU7CHL0_9TELE|nr:hypothetical protein [Ataeniobius toweri]
MDPQKTVILYAIHELPGKRSIFLAGKMIAVSIVHGGPAPHFLSKNLVNHMIGNPSFSATVEDVKDEEMGKVLQQVLEAESVESLQNVILQNSTMFQTAGCLRGVKTCEKQAFMEEYLKWYIIDRNHSANQRKNDSCISGRAVDVCNWKRGIT